MRKTALHRFAAGVLSCALLSGFPLSVSGAEAPAKDFLYYRSLADYEVYTEYCSVFGVSAEAALPEEEALPDYDPFWYYVDRESVVFEFLCEAALADQLSEDGAVDAQQMDFPESWGDSVIAVQNLSLTSQEIDGIAYDRIAVRFDLTEMLPTYDIIDLYRIRLTLQNSGFMAQNSPAEEAVQYVTYLSRNSAKPEAPVFGDAGGDGVCDTKDAARILEWSALAGGAVIITEEEAWYRYGIDLRVSDVSADAVTDAKDAALILSYQAAYGAGYTGTLEEFIAERDA